MLRRSSETTPSPPQGRLLHFGSWRLDTTARHLLTPDNVILPLSGAEFRLLCIFLERPQQVLSRDTLLDAQANPAEHQNLIVRVWGWSGHFVQLDRA